MTKQQGTEQQEAHCLAVCLSISHNAPNRDENGAWAKAAILSLTHGQILELTSFIC